MSDKNLGTVERKNLSVWTNLERKTKKINILLAM